MTDRCFFLTEEREKKSRRIRKPEIIRKAMSGDVRLNFDYSDPDAEEQLSQRFRNVSPYCLVWFERRFILSRARTILKGTSVFSPFGGLTNLVSLSVPREKLFVYSGDVDFNMQYYVNGIFSSEADIEPFSRLDSTYAEIFQPEIQIDTSRGLFDMSCYFIFINLFAT